jgi:hypothetical protein
MNFTSFYHQVAEMENIGYKNCNTAEDYLTKAIDAKEIPQAEGDKILADIIKVRKAIPAFGDSMRQRCRQFAQLCRDTSIETMLKEIADAQVQHVQDNQD